MPLLVVNGATLKCSFGVAPSNLVITPEKMILVNNQPAATIMDHVPMKNIQPFGMCNAPTNPQVIAATSAALGVFTPQTCMPATSAPWAPGSTTMVKNIPALHDGCKLMCNWAGVIEVILAGQTTVNAK